MIRQSKTDYSNRSEARYYTLTCTHCDETVRVRLASHANPFTGWDENRADDDILICIGRHGAMPTDSVASNFRRARREAKRIFYEMHIDCLAPRQLAELEKFREERWIAQEEQRRLQAAVEKSIEEERKLRQWASENGHRSRRSCDHKTDKHSLENCPGLTNRPRPDAE